MSWELWFVFKSTVLLGGTLAVLGLATGMRASRRHLILAAAFAALLVLPISGTLLLPFRGLVEVPPPPVEEPRVATAQLVSAIGVGTLQPPVRPGAVMQRLAPAAWGGFDIGRLLRYAWLAGVVSLLAMLGASLSTLYHLRRFSERWNAGEHIAAAIAKELGVRQRLLVMLNTRTFVPATFGFLRPTILLPADAPQWSETDLRRVLIHEIEHIRRDDWSVQLAARAVCALYWFNPLIWLAWRQLRVEAERACDDAVVERTDRADYAEQLVTLATRMMSPHRLTLSIASRGDLSIRIGAILNAHQHRGRSGPLVTATIIAVFMLYVGAVAPPVTFSRQPSPASGSAQARHPAASASAVTPVAAGGDRSRSKAREAEPRTVPRVHLVTGEDQTSVTAAAARQSAAIPAPGAAASQWLVDRAAAAAYVIGPGDVLTIAFWRDREASGDVVVRPDGMISLPLIGDLPAGGLTPAELRQVVIQQREQFVTDDQVTVQVKQINSRKVFIVGSIVKPGVYELGNAMTVLQLIATAGGLTNAAKKTPIVIARQADGEIVNLSFDYTAFVSGRQPEQNILLMPGDTVVVP